MRGPAFIATLLLGYALPAAAQDPPHLFQLPVDCDMTSVCSIQLYVDMDPTDEYSDHMCGHLSYDGHNGTDIRVRHLADMRTGIPVVAAAPGVVVGVRDGMDDISVSEIGLDALNGRHAGNGVGIDHGDGWFTQYSHLRKGSVSVTKGDRVSAGDQLGLIGLSGKSNFPHVDFEVRFRRKPVNPFVGLVDEFRCNTEHQPLWTEDALAAMPYREAWLLSAGFADEAVQIEKIRQGDYDLAKLPEDTAVLSFWFHYGNVVAGDKYLLTIYAPDGSTLLQNIDLVERTQYIFYAFAGLRRPSEGWPVGTYRGTLSVSRDGREVLSAERTITVQ